MVDSGQFAPWHALLIIRSIIVLPPLFLWKLSMGRYILRVKI